MKLNRFDQDLLACLGAPISFEALRAGRHKAPPKERGVYAVIFPGTREPSFLGAGTGGTFKGRRPNLPVRELRERWVSGSHVLYLGKAGASTQKAHLRQRLSAYSRFGSGKPASHWGGRAIWQISDSAQLLVRWWPTLGQEPRDLEVALLEKFREHYGTLPFANRQA